MTGVIGALIKSQIRIEGFRVVARRHNNFHEKARIVKGRLGDSHLNFKKELFKLEAQVGKSWHRSPQAMEFFVYIQAP